ncbi:MAG: helix-turn-helix domain-containing protein, partial [Succinivibrio sp.]
FACCTGGGALVSTPDGISCSLREGNVLAAESDFPGECRPLPDRGCQALWFIAGSRFLQNALTDMRPEFFIALSCPPVHEAPPLARGLFRLLGEFLETGTPEGVAVASDLVHSVAVLLRAQTQQRERQMQFPASTGHTENLCNLFYVLLSENCREHRDVEFYARRMCVSPGYLAAVVSRYGESPKQAITRQTVAEIKKLLRNSDKNIDSIARELHFKDPSYMGRFWKKETGLTLSGYRKSFRLSE